VYIPDKWVLAVNYDKETDGFVPYPKSWPKLHTHAMIHPGPPWGYSLITWELTGNQRQRMEEKDLHFIN